MALAVEAAGRVRHRTSPNPWVGAVVVDTHERVSIGTTNPPGGPHAEREALTGSGSAAAGATLYTTLEPCNHTGRTGPCTEAIIEAEIARVVIGIEDPDPLVAGTGIARLIEAGVKVDVGVMADEITEQLAPYLHHRRTGRPWIVLKMAASADGRTAAPDGSSQWITGPEARADAHRLRAESDAILVGAATVRADDPSLTVRDRPTDRDDTPIGEITDPRRVVLGTAPVGAKVHPCLEWSGTVPDLLDQLGSQGIVQLMVEGGASVARSFHHAGLVDRYAIYWAPILFGGDDARGLFSGPGVESLDDVWRGEIVAVTRLGADLRIDLRAASAAKRGSR